MRIAKGILVVVTALVVGALAAPGACADDKKFGDGTDGLKAFWDDIVKSAQAGDEKAVTAALEGTAMSDDQFAAVFADAATATAIAGKYKAAHAKGWGMTAKGLIAKIKGDGLDTVTAADVTADKKEQKAENSRVVPLLKPGVKMYLVRLSKAADGKDATGAKARFDSFFFLDGKWVSGWKLASFLEKPKAAAPAAGPKPPAGGDKPADPPKPADPAKPADPVKPADDKKDPMGGDLGG